MTGVNEIVTVTITISRLIEAPVATVWDAYADPAKRARWSVPAGEALIYDTTDFCEEGQDRCAATRDKPPDLAV